MPTLPGHKFLLAIALLSVAACGDPLVDGTYRGEPLTSIRGSILVFDQHIGQGAFEAPEHPRVTMTWAELGDGPSDRPPFESHIALTQQFPGN